MAAMLPPWLRKPYYRRWSVYLRGERIGEVLARIIHERLKAAVARHGEGGARGADRRVLGREGRARSGHAAPRVRAGVDGRWARSAEPWIKRTNGRATLIRGLSR